MPKQLIESRARRLVKSLRCLNAGDKQHIAGAAANVMEALLERLAQSDGVVQHQSVKLMECEHGSRFGVEHAH